MNKFDPLQFRKDFPILNMKNKDKSLIYLDNGATTQKPKEVLSAMEGYNISSNGNPHRGAHILSVLATEKYDKAKESVKNFINASSSEEIIFTRNTTESINLVAQSYGMNFINENDEILIAISEHHSNILPWQHVARTKGAILKYMYLDENFRISSEEIERKITKNTKFVSVAHMSNVLGTILPIKEIIQRAHAVGAKVLVDGAQSTPHMKVDVQSLGADFYVFSAHKMLGPMGIGVLYGKKSLLEDMPPFLLGGDMIEYVTEQDYTHAPLPFKFEAGTQNVEGAVGLNAAINYLKKVGLENISKHERVLTEYALDKISSIAGINILGPKDLDYRGGIVSFTMDNIHPHDVASILDSYGIAVRSGHHCAQPLMKYLNLNSSSRASFYLYNTKDDIDAFIDGLKNVKRWFAYGS